MDRNSVKVSVIMPSLNVGAYIAECIESAINQTLKDIEIICVDAGSTDGTLEILREYEKKDNRIKVIVSDVKSYGRQLNLGFDMATGEYIAILETDDIIKSDMYEFLYGEAIKIDADIVKSDFESFIDSEDGRKINYMTQFKDGVGYNAVMNPLQDLNAFMPNNPSTWSSIYKRSFLTEKNIRNHETPGAAFQDTSLWFLTLAKAEKVLFVNKAFYMLRRDRAESSVFNRGKIYSIFDEYKFIEQEVDAETKANENFIKIFWKKKFDHCMYHYTRIADEFKIFYLCRMSDEFKKAFEGGAVDEILFKPEQIKDLEEIIYRPEEFNARSRHHFHYKLKKEYEALNIRLDRSKKEYEDLKSSPTYKVGHMILFIPKKIRGGIRCYKDNGLKYTIKRFFTKIKGN